MGMYAIERSYPKVGVGQIWKQYLKQLKTYADADANADADAYRRRRQRLGDNISSPGHSPGELKIELHSAISFNVYPLYRFLLIMGLFDLLL